MKRLASKDDLKISPGLKTTTQKRSGFFNARKHPGIFI